MKRQDSKSEECIFRTYITLKDGTRIYAKQYGIKAFRIPVDNSKE